MRISKELYNIYNWNIFKTCLFINKFIYGEIFIYFFLKANKKIKDTLICNINMKIIFLLINFQ